MAIEQARTAALRGEVPIGALVVMHDRVLAAAGNRTITDCDPTAHAEVVALRTAAHEFGNYPCLNGAALYVTLEPCAMCAGALVQARIARLIYGADDTKGRGGSARACKCSTFPRSITVWKLHRAFSRKNRIGLLRSFFAARRS